MNREQKLLARVAELKAAGQAFSAKSLELRDAVRAIRVQYRAAKAEVEKAAERLERFDNENFSADWVYPDPDDFGELLADTLNEAATMGRDVAKDPYKV